MYRFLLCTAIAAAAHLALSVAPAAAHCGSDYYYHDPFGFIGFLDYRHSLDRDDYREDRGLDCRREYVFHGMSAHEAYNEWHGGGHDGGRTHRHDHGGCGDSSKWLSRAHAVTKTHHTGGGEHMHAWGVHSSDASCED